MTRQVSTASGEDEHRSSATLGFRLLGPLRINRGSEEVELSGVKRRALLIFLSLHLGEAVSPDRIVEALWPRRRTGREEATLQVHISHLRDRLETDRSASPKVLVTTGAGYMIDRQEVDLDLERFDSLVSGARGLIEEDPEIALDELNQALGLWRGRPLQDVEYEEFAQDEIRRLELVRSEAVLVRAEALIELDRDSEAVQDLEARIRADPTDERSASLLMKALYRTGRQAAALRAFRRHARHLARRGLEPSPAIALLEERILAHDPALLPDKLGSPRDIRPGYSLRGFELRAEVGAGKVGTVYRAYQAGVGREVAVKVVNPDLAQAPEFIRRFSDEARLIASLEHPHIVPLYDFWREPLGAFLVTRWMPGGSLRNRRGDPFHLDMIGRLFGQMANAVEYAHSAGIVHGDLHASNIFFDKAGNAYVADFSLASVGLEERLRATRHHDPQDPPGVGGIDDTPTMSSDVRDLGLLLGETIRSAGVADAESSRVEALAEVVAVATASEAGDRFPDMSAFQSALRDAVGPVQIPAPRRIRRNPFRGLEPFEEIHRVDFYGRDDVVDSLLDAVSSRHLVALVGPSGSGKSSVVKAGVVPQLRDGAIPGSDEWSIVQMTPGLDPFEEFHVALNAVAVTDPSPVPRDPSRELTENLDGAFDGPSDKSLLFIDQFEELFSSEVDDETRERFLDNLVRLTDDPSGRYRVLLTLRADFSDRPLSHPAFGDLIARGSILLGPMRLEQVEEAIRRPVARVGIQVEPGLISEIVREVTTTQTFLPMLQYLLSELFERRTEDRLTIEAYRRLGGLSGLLDRQAEATFSSLTEDSRQASRQVFLRLVSIGEAGEMTGRRVPVSELKGISTPESVEEVLDAFTAARLLTHDRDPVNRAPTVELSHETVIGGWHRLHGWLEQAQSDLQAHRRLKTAASEWAGTGHDPAYLLTGGPLSSALELAGGDRIALNQLEFEFVTESRETDLAKRRLEVEQRQKAEALQRRARRRLGAGLAAGAIAVIIGLLAVLAFFQSQRASDLATAGENRSLALALTAAALNNLDSDPELSLRLSIAAAEASLEADASMLPEVVDALHRSLVTPKSEVLADGAATIPQRGFQLLDWSDDGSMVAYVTDDGGVVVLDPTNGAELVGLPPLTRPAIGVEIHPDGSRLLTIHDDAVREWSLEQQAVVRELGEQEGVSVATYSPDGQAIAIGGNEGAVAIWPGEGEPVTWVAHDARVASVSYSPNGERLVTAGDDAVHVWDVASREIVSEAPAEFVAGVIQARWAPTGDHVVVSMAHGEMFYFDATTGVRGSSFSSGTIFQLSLAFDSSGGVLVSAGRDGFVRIYNTALAGAPLVELANGGVPLKGLETNPTRTGSPDIVAIDTEGRLLIWRDVLAGGLSELPARSTMLLYPNIASAGDRYLLSGHGRVWILGAPPDAPPVIEVVDAEQQQVLLERESLDSTTGFLDHESALSPDGKTVAFPGSNGDVEIVEVDTGETRVLSQSENWNKTLAFSPRSRLLAGAGFDGSIVIWDLESGTIVDTLETSDLPPLAESTRFGNLLLPRQAISDIAFSPDGSHLAWTRNDGRTGTWNIDTGAITLLYSFSHPARSLAFDSSGSRLASSDTTGEIVVLDPATGEVVGRPAPVSGGTELTFSPDGSLLAGAGPGEHVYLWDGESYELIRRLEASFGVPSSAAFVAGGAELRVAGSAGFDRGFLVHPDDLLELARAEDPRPLTEAECLRYLGRQCNP